MNLDDMNCELLKKYPKCEYRALLKKIRAKTATREETERFREIVREWQKLTDKVKRE